MSHLISDVLNEEISPNICNSAVSAGGKLLKVVEMQHRYGRPRHGGEEKELILCSPNGPDPVKAQIERLQQEIDTLKVRA